MSTITVTTLASGNETSFTDVIVQDEGLTLWLTADPELTTLHIVGHDQNIMHLRMPSSVWKKALALAANAPALPGALR